MLGNSAIGETALGETASKTKKDTEKDTARPVTWVNNQGLPVEWQNNQGEPVTFVSGSDVAQQTAERHRNQVAATASDNFSNTPLPLRVEPVPQARNAITDTGLPPPSEKSSFDTARFDTATFDGAVSEKASATDTVDAVVTRNANTRVSIEQRIEHRISEQLTDIRDATRVLAARLIDQVMSLKASGANDTEPLNFLEDVATGLAAIADALNRAIEAKSNGKSERIFLGTAAKIVDGLNEKIAEWFESEGVNAVDYTFKIGAAGLGFALLSSLGVPTSEASSLIAGIILGRVTK